MCIPQAPQADLRMNKKEGFASKSFFFIQQSAVGGQQSANVRDARFLRHKAQVGADIIRPKEERRMVEAKRCLAV